MHGQVDGWRDAWREARHESMRLVQYVPAAPGLEK